jgi:hypothetical protein
MQCLVISGTFPLMCFHTQQAFRQSSQPKFDLSLCSCIHNFNLLPIKFVLWKNKQKFSSTFWEKLETSEVNFSPKLFSFFRFAGVRKSFPWFLNCSNFILMKFASCSEGEKIKSLCLFPLLLLVLCKHNLLTERLKR